MGARRGRAAESVGMTLIGPKNGWSGCEADGEVGGSGKGAGVEDEDAAWNPVSAYRNIVNELELHTRRR